MTAWGCNARATPGRHPSPCPLAPSSRLSPPPSPLPILPPVSTHSSPPPPPIHLPFPQPRGTPGSFLVLFVCLFDEDLRKKPPVREHRRVDRGGTRRTACAPKEAGESRLYAKKGAKAATPIAYVSAHIDGPQHCEQNKMLTL